MLVLFAPLHVTDASDSVPGLLSCCVQTPAAPSGLEPPADLLPVTAGTSDIDFVLSLYHEGLKCPLPNF